MYLKHYVYVDDIVVTGNDHEGMETLKNVWQQNLKLRS